MRYLICLPLIVVFLASCKNSKSSSGGLSGPKGNSSSNYPTSPRGTSDSSPGGSSSSSRDGSPNPASDTPSYPPNNQAKSIAGKNIQTSKDQGFTLLSKVLTDISNGKKININTKDSSKGNITALHQAVEIGGEDLIQLLLQQGALVNAQDDNGFTALHAAVRMDKLTSIQALVKNDNIDINKQDKLGNTVLHLAAAKGNKPIVTALLENKKIDVNVRQGSDGDTPLQLATANGHKDVIQALSDRGAR